ncbi:geranylgeranylglycerol-phosphate geranylgeranyltransferase [Halobacteriales archaeon SW_8_65_20]|nr:MAG: geranylgeranylglycerol-phosphate geranylgeranyltransferase [Halobacteriales archaeon SW_8_65_20]
MERARGLIELTRPGNALTSGLLTAIGALVAGTATTAGLFVDASAPVRAAAAVLATMLAVGAGNAINDYFDREIDAINQPGRPIPRGAVTPSETLAFAAVQFGVAVGGEVGPVVVLAALAALATFAREVIKDVEDIDGDREKGLNTLPIAIGERRALQVAMAALLVGIAGSPLPYLLSGFGVAYLVAVAVPDLLMLTAGYWGFTDPTRGQLWLKYGQLLAAGAFILGRFT